MHQQRVLQQLLLRSAPQFSLGRSFTLTSGIRANSIRVAVSAAVAYWLGNEVVFGWAERPTATFVDTQGRIALHHVEAVWNSEVLQGIYP